MTSALPSGARGAHPHLPVTVRRPAAEAVYAGFEEPPAAQRLWRVGADVIGTIDLASAVSDVAAGDNGVFVLVHRRSDRPDEPQGRPGYTVDFRPGALLIVDADGSIKVIAERQDIDGRLFYDSGQLWTTGFGRREAGRRNPRR